MSQDFRKIVAQNVKKLREMKGKKREEVSLALGLDNSYISKLECSNINLIKAIKTYTTIFFSYVNNYYASY